MFTIRENDFHRIDLNLLTVLLVLKREGSVSRAAEKLHLGQPAVSNALARLRTMFDDPLFVRTAQGMEPTPRAEALIEALGPLMEQMQQVLFQPESFSGRYHPRHVAPRKNRDPQLLYTLASCTAPPRSAVDAGELCCSPSCAGFLSRGGLERD